MEAGTDSAWLSSKEALAASLRRSFGVSSLGNKRNPLDELVYIVLSTRTPPESYQTAYRQLRRAFPLWEHLAEASVQDIADAITVGGLQAKKARQLRGIAEALRDRFGRVSLAPLHQMSDAEAEKVLLELPGVGVKVARCVLMYSLDREVFPVDRHCLRVVRRLGWVDPSRPLGKKLADEIQEAIPGPVRKQVHVGMILLGRSICLPSNPSCSYCPILQMCPTGTSRGSAGMPNSPE